MVHFDTTNGPLVYASNFIPNRVGFRTVPPGDDSWETIVRMQRVMR